VFTWIEQRRSDILKALNDDSSAASLCARDPLLITSSRTNRPHARLPCRCTRSVEWGWGRFLSAPTEDDERN